MSDNGREELSILEDGMDDILEEIKKQEEEDPFQDEAPFDVKMAILEQEISQWRNSRFILEVRYRVNKRIENKEQMELCKKEMENAEQALLELRATMKEEKRLEETRKRKLQKEKNND